MRVGYDAKRAFLNKTGLGNYSRWLIRSLASYHSRNEYYLYTPKIKPGNNINFLSGLQRVTTVLPKSKLFTAWWRSSGILKDLQRDQIDVYHGLSHELPAGIAKTGIKSVVTIHDLIFMRFPQYFSWVNRIIYGAKVKYACHVAEKIIAISERTKQDIIELIGISSDKIEVIYQGCNQAFKSAISVEQKQAVLKKYGLPNEFILSVGTIEERKNLLHLVKALPELDQPIKFVAIGRKTDYTKKVEQALNELHLNERVLLLDSVSFDDLPAIYQSAKVFVYPSRYEGFGIPVLEALCSGTPVIAATGSCLEEAGGTDSLYADPDDVSDMAYKLNLVLNDEDLRQKMIIKGREYSANFDDKELSDQIMAVYKKIIHHA